MVIGYFLTFHVIGIIVSIMSYDYLYGGNLKVPPLLNALQVITTLTGFLIYFIEGFSLMQMDIFTKLRKNPKLHTILLIVVGSISITGVTFTISHRKRQTVIHRIDHFTAFPSTNLYFNFNRYVKK